MPRKPSPGGATTPRQFRFTEAEVESIDRIAAMLRTDPDVPVTRTTALRIAIRIALHELDKRKIKEPRIDPHSHKR